MISTLSGSTTCIKSHETTRKIVGTDYKVSIDFLNSCRLISMKSLHLWLSRSGYIPLEFYRSGNEYPISVKFDVYSYGLIVLELLSDRSDGGGILSPYTLLPFFFLK